jgi:hypothetical protein
VKARPYSPPQWTRLQAQRTQQEIDRTVPPLWVGAPPVEGQRGLVLATIAFVVFVLVAVVALVAWGLGGLR